MGTALLIAPPPPNTSIQRQASKIPHYIACLFTSLDYGKRVSPAEEILENTRNALKDLAKQVAEMRALDEDMGNCYAVRINSGKFGVEWQKTKAVLEAGELDITVVRPEEGKADVAGVEVGGQPSMTGSGAKDVKHAKATTAKVEGPLDKHMVGVKRKFKADIDEDDDSVRDNAKGEQSTRIHPGSTKREKLGLDG